ncbi:MAG: translation initiation factor IF-3, partial [Clostridiales bacterium]|nr:translation initiation factor IF-3 [Clostridiales bacterium]
MSVFYFVIKYMEVLDIKVDHIINDRITAKELRVVDEDGGQLGIMQRNDALKAAFDKDFDLVLIAPKANPPVAKIMDYGKYRYQEEKKLKEQRKNQVKIVVKEIKLSVKIAENDVAYKVKHARE